MASADLQKFLEDRLTALDPTVDLSPGAPAQTKFIQPVLTYLGTDPFETDIDAFITDRFAQEFPDIYADNPGAIRDSFVKPAILLLEPFKRETNSIRLSQSLVDPTLLSDDDADALVANVFDSRDPGGYAVGSARVYFQNAVNVRAEVATKIYSGTGLNFFPTNPVAITAESMLFNREGSLFYMDLPVRAEKAGDEYNIDAGELAGVDGIPNVVKVANLRKFTGGSPRQDTSTLVASADQSLTERSLNTRRGAFARISTVFKGSVRAVQVVGAKDPEMQRDIIVATSPGHAWIQGVVQLYQNVAYVRARMVEGDLDSVPATGDTLYIYLDAQATTVRLRVEQLLFTTGAVAAIPPDTRGYLKTYFVQWSDADGALAAALGTDLGAFLDAANTCEGGFSKKGTVKISSIPDAGKVDLTVDNQSVHVFGHTDVYVRPSLQDVTKVVVGGVYDVGALGDTENNPHFVWEQSTLNTTVDSNQVSDSTPGFSFAGIGVLRGDMLSVEDGPDAGLYVIGEVSGATLTLTQPLKTTKVGLRYKILKKVRINPFETNIVRFPFGNNAVSNDLSTTIGKNLVVLSQNDLVMYGVRTGDVLRILDSADAGDYVITAFDSTLGGRGLVLDSPMTGTNSNLRYEVFTPQDSVLRPLVRIRELLLLDSAKQSTGLTIPPADPVAVTPVGPLASAKVLGKSALASGYVIPDLADIIDSYGDHAASNVAGNDRRYSLGFDTPEGFYVSTAFTTTRQAELDLHANADGGAARGKCSFFVATTETFNDAVNYPPVDPKPGECLNITSGPNKGSYLIRAVHKFKYDVATSVTAYVYFIQIYGTFPVDPLRQIIDFLWTHGTNDTGLGAMVWPIQFPGFFNDPATGWYATLGGRLRACLLAESVTNVPSADELQAVIDAMCGCTYEWGSAARGVFRSFFREPTLFEQRTGESLTPTVFSHLLPSGDVVKFRPDPTRYVETQVVPAKLVEETDPTEYPRNSDVCYRITFENGGDPFTVGATLTGDAQGGTAIIVEVNVTGPNAGNLLVRDLRGVFLDGEGITDSEGGTASVALGTQPVQEQIYFPGAVTTVFGSGVSEGDVLAIHEELPVYPVNGTPKNPLWQTLVQTEAGSNILTAPASAGGPFMESMIGALLFIEEGQDAGGYRITGYVDASHIIVDRVLGATTALNVKTGSSARWGLVVTDNKVAAPAGQYPFEQSDVGQYLTLYGIDYRWMGSFPIASVESPQGNLYNTAVLTLPTDFPPIQPPGSGTGRWIVTPQPTTAPAAVTRDPALTVQTGTETLGGVPVRIYEAAPRELDITAVLPSTSASGVTPETGFSVFNGVKQPYRIFRPDVRRVTPTEMSEKQDGFLYYFDTEVVSLSPSVDSNLPENSYLTYDEGTFDSIGYRHAVEDPNFTYSVKEAGFLDLPLHILPVGAADSLDSMVRVVGAPVQISYERSDTVELVQEFADSAEDRVTSASFLVRHFLPAYVSYDATYAGGASETDITKDVRAYIDSLAIETPVDVSEVEKIIEDAGGNVDTPTKVSATIYDWDRRMWVEFSEDQLGGATALDTKVPYNGSPRVTFFSPGQDVSGLEELPSGERIRLTRR